MYVFLSAFCYGLFLHCYYHQTVIGLVISVSDEWQEMGDKIIDKL